MASGNLKVQKLLSFKEIFLPSVFLTYSNLSLCHYGSFQLQEIAGLPLPATCSQSWGIFLPEAD